MLQPRLWKEEAVAVGKEEAVADLQGQGQGQGRGRRRGSGQGRGSTSGSRGPRVPYIASGNIKSGLPTSIDKYIPDSMKASLTGWEDKDLSEVR